MKYLRWIFLGGLVMSLVSWVIFNVMYDGGSGDTSLDNRMLSLRYHLAILEVLAFYIAYRVSKD